MKITKDDLINMGCNPDHVDDWFQIRKEKRAPSLTSTAWERIANQFAKAGLTIPEGVEACGQYEWRGFQAEWYFNKVGRPVSMPNNIHPIDDARQRKEGVRAALRDIQGTDW